MNNLEYGSNAPGAPNVFLTDAELPALWGAAERRYLFIEGPSVERLVKLVGRESLVTVQESGGKLLFTNHPL